MSQTTSHLRPDRPTVSAASAELLSGVGFVVMAGNLLLIGLLAAFIGWAAWATVDEVTVGEGRVIPSQKVQIVQNLEGGIIKKLYVRDGTIVKRGDLLVQIDSTSLGSDLRKDEEKIAGLRARSARLKAETNLTPLTFDDALVASHPNLVRQERQLFESRRRELTSALDALRQITIQRRQQIIEAESKSSTLTRTLRLAKSEMALTAPLVAQGAASKIEVIRLKGKISELEGELEAATLSLPRLRAAIAEAESQINERRSIYQSKALADLTKNSVELAALLQASQSQQDKVDRTDVRAPANGIVKRLLVNTIGQVVRPGADIAEIVPVDDTLLVEAKIRPQDIAFVHAGQNAVVKLSAYDYSIYGGLDAKLERISPDAITTDKGETYYLVEVRTNTAYLETDGDKLPIMPGMLASVDLMTGQKTVLQYLVKPFVRMRAEALRER